MTEFGSGVVVPLAKFSEHLQNESENRVWSAIRWTKMSEDEKSKTRQEATIYPRGDAARQLSDVTVVLGSVESSLGWTEEKAISQWIVVWMNGASDHFYDLDREKAPQSLIELADLCLEIGHGFDHGKTWDESTMKQIRDLWKKSCLEVDKLLDVNGDWGEW